MAVSRTRARTASAVVLAAALLTAGLTAAPAMAEDPPLDWTTVAGYPKSVNEVTVTWQTAMSSTTSPFGGAELQEPLPLIRADFVNDSGDTKHFGLGMDLTVQGVVDPLWELETWGVTEEAVGGFIDTFWLSLDPGESFSTDDGEGNVWSMALPMWTGHTMRIFELSEAPIDGATPLVTTLDSFVVPGRFVGANLESLVVDDISALIGERASVDGGGGSPDLFPGLSATATASGLTPGEQLELWIAPNLDYFYFFLLGGGLPVNATHVGTDIVAADGTLTADFTLPASLPYGTYQLVVGDSAERYWPAGSYGDFLVTEPPNAESAETQPGADTADIPLGSTSASITYPATASGGTTTVTVTGTGPAPDGFQLVGGGIPLYFHISTTATFTEPVEVCFTYSTANLPGDPPWLHHYDSAQGRWFNITTTREPGRVCGSTTSFSPFALGFPDTFDFDGFFAPVSMAEPNVAKAGQAIPVSFSLGGDQGLEVVTSAKFVIEGTDANPSGELLDAVTAGRSGLTYDASADRYIYVWKTDKAWAKKTGQFVLTLSDGTTHTFDVSFKK